MVLSIVANKDANNVDLSIVANKTAKIEMAVAV